jgi:dUTPase
MPTHLNLNPDLLQEAIDFDSETPIETLIETALRSYIDQRKRLQVIELFGTIDYDEDYDYKQQRALP